MTLLFASNNKNKLFEVSKILKGIVEVKSLKDFDFYQDIPEPFETIKENALHKARVLNEKFSVACFADDTGLEVEALNGAPGVYSARYAGENCTPDDNVQKMLKALSGTDNRNALFRTIIALVTATSQYTFEGTVQGRIATEKMGEKGFGYDPIFIPNGNNKSFAQMDVEEKNQISHRGLALKKFTQFLSENKLENL